MSSLLFLLLRAWQCITGFTFGQTAGWLCAWGVICFLRGHKSAGTNRARSRALSRADHHSDRGDGLCGVYHLAIFGNPQIAERNGGPQPQGFAPTAAYTKRFEFAGTGDARHA